MGRSRNRPRAWRSGAAVLAFLVAAVGMLPVLASADSISVRGTFGIWSHGGDSPDIPEPLLEFLFYFEPLTANVPSLIAIDGEAYGTSAPHNSTGGLQFTRSPVHSSLRAGDAYDLSSSWTWTSGVMQDVLLGDFCCEYLRYATSGTFAVTAGTARLERDGDQLAGRAPFTFTGVVNAFEPATGAALFQRQFQGAGEARVYLNPSLGSFAYVYRAEPVPEPATMVLLGGGLGLMALRARRRR